MYRVIWMLLALVFWIPISSALELQPVGAAPTTVIGGTPGRARSFVYQSKLERLVLSLRPHGISYDEAQALGAESIPALLEVIKDPKQKAHWVTAIVAIGFLGRKEAVEDLIAFYEQTASPADLETLRAHLAIPFALGSIAANDEGALGFLLDRLDRPDTRIGSGEAVSVNLIQARRDRLLIGLGVSGSPRALEVLESFDDRSYFIGLDNRQQSHVRDVLDLANEIAVKIATDGRSSYFSYRPPLWASQVNRDVSGRGFPPPVSVGARRHIQASYSDAQFDADLLSATTRLFNIDTQCGSNVDVACPVSFQRSGNVGTFGVAGDGLNSITTQTQLNLVFSVPNARAKFVTVLDFCGGLNPSIVGCAPVGGDTMILETGFSGSALFLHEYGHNAGLFHRDDCSSNVMSSFLGDDRVVNQSECNAFGGGGVTLPLRLRFQGGGSGVVSVGPTNQSCQADCTVEIPFATAVTLTLTASPDSFASGCSGGCSFIMNDRIEKSVQFFNRAAVSLLLTPPESFYQVGGSISGLGAGQSVILRNETTGETLTRNANGTYAFATAQATGATYNVIVQTQPAGQTCTVANGTGTIGSTNVTNINVSCATNTYTVGGSIAGLASGLSVTLRNATTGENLTRNANGSFVFTTAQATGTAYNVTVQTQPAGQTCTVANGTGTIGSTNVTNVNVSCSTSTFTVGGSITGLGTGLSVVLRNAATGENLTRSANGAYTFATAQATGTSYNVTVQTQPSGQTCTVTNGSGTVGSANISNVNVTCATNTYTVGGSITGLGTGLSVVLRNATTSESLTRSVNGIYNFATAQAPGASYNVIVQTQPTGQTCTVANDSGSIGSANVTNVNVSCQNAGSFISTPDSGTTLDFGNVIHQQSRELTVVLGNGAAAGGTAFDITGCSLAGAGYSRVDNLSFPLALNPGATIVLRVRLSTTAALSGPITGTLTCTHNAPGSGSASWPLTGRSVPEVVFVNGFEN